MILHEKIQRGKNVFQINEAQTKQKNKHLTLMNMSVEMYGYICVCSVAQSCPTLCDPMDCSLPGSSVYGILQARILVWVAMPPPEDLLNPGIEPTSLLSPLLQVHSLPLSQQGRPRGYMYSIVNHVMYYVYVSFLIKIYFDSGCFLVIFLHSNEKKCLHNSESESRSVVSDSLRPHGLYSLWNSLGQNTGVGSLSLFQGVFPNQGLNPGLSHCWRILLPVEPQGKPKILEWVAIPSPADLPNPGIDPGSPALQADSQQRTAKQAANFLFLSSLF